MVSVRGRTGCFIANDAVRIDVEVQGTQECGLGSDGDQRVLHPSNEGHQPPHNKAGFTTQKLKLHHDQSKSQSVSIVDRGTFFRLAACTANKMPRCGTFPN